MRELLIRYLLGELDAHEQDQLEAQLRDSAELRRELAHLRSCFAAACDADYRADDPPCGLAERTARRVTAASCDAGGIQAAQTGPTISAVAEPPAGVLGWSMADLTVAGGVFLAVSMLLFPALRDSRDATRRLECQNNMQHFAQVSFQYAQDHGNYLPCANPQDYSGALVIRLVNEGYVAPEDVARWMLCPSSGLAEKVRGGKAQIRIPLFYFRPIPGPLPAELCRMASGSYALRLGYVDGNRYHWIRNSGSDREPFMSDEPDFEIADFQSGNHGGYGQNVLYLSGRVAFQTTPTVPGRNDHIFLNALGKTAAGHGPDDAVLVRGDRTPGVEVPVQSP